MKKLILTIFFIFCFVVSVQATTYSVCADGCDLANNAAVNAVNFADGDIIEFERGETFEDANLTFAAITNPTTKTITIQDRGAGALPWIGGDEKGIYINNNNQDGLSLVIKNIKIDSQEGSGGYPKVYLVDLKDITIDGITGDGSINWISANTTAIAISGATGTIEIKNNTLKYWGGDDDLWATPATPTGTGVDRHILAISTSTGGGNIHDNDFENAEADCIQIEDSDGLNFYDNTLWNAGENSLDIKGSANITAYRNTMGRDATWTGIGGDSTGQQFVAVLNIITRPANHTENISVHDNLIGPTDLNNIHIGYNRATYYTNNVSVYNNWFEPAKWQVVIEEDTRNIKIYYNIFDGIAANGLFWWEYHSDALMPPTPPVVYNNNFYQGTDTGTPATFKGTTGQHLIRLYDDNTDGCADSTWENNAFYINDDNAPAGTGNYIMFIDTLCNPTMDHNIWFNAYAGNDEIILWHATPYGEDDQAAWIAAGHTGAIFDNPDWIDPANDDFILQAGSPCKDAGATLAEAYDDGWDPGTSLPPNTVDTLDQDLYGWTIGCILYALLVHSVSPPDGADGISINTDITWDYASIVDDVDLWFDTGTCVATTDCDGSPDSDDDADKTYDPGTLSTNTDYCVGFKANDGEAQGDCQEYDFQTQSENPPAPGVTLSGKFSQNGVTGMFSQNGANGIFK